MIRSSEEESSLLSLRGGLSFDSVAQKGSLAGLVGGERVGELEEGCREEAGGGGGGSIRSLTGPVDDEPVGDPAPWEPDEGYEGDGIRGEPRYRLSPVMMVACG